MLKAIFGSEPKVKILNFLLLHPEANYSLRQISQTLDLANSMVRREIESLEKHQLIKSVIENDTTESKEQEITEKSDKLKGKAAEKNAKSSGVRYFINKNFLLYPEIKALFIKAQILSSEKFITGLQKIGQLKLLLMTGIFTNDTEAPTDILIVGHIKRGPLLKLIKDLEKDLGREINFTILSEREFHYRQEMMDIFLYNILEGKNLTLLDKLDNKPKK